LLLLGDDDGQKSAVAQLEDSDDDDDNGEKFESCFTTSLLLHLGHSIFSLLKMSVSNFSLHFLHINSNNGIFLLSDSAVFIICFYFE
jgi:hypothetical protein